MLIKPIYISCVNWNSMQYISAIVIGKHILIKVIITDTIIERTNPWAARQVT